MQFSLVSYVDGQRVESLSEMSFIAQDSRCAIIYIYIYKQPEMWRTNADHPVYAQHVYV
jgi:hypothetical protein